MIISFNLFDHYNNDYKPSYLSHRMTLTKVITKAAVKKAQCDSELMESLRQAAIRVEINTLLASGSKIFEYTDRKDITNEDIQRIKREYSEFNPQIRSYRQPGEDIGEIYFDF
jgi:hypothetical protein